MAITLVEHGRWTFFVGGRSGPTASAVHKPCSPAVPGRNFLNLQLGHWSSSVPQNEPSNTHRLQENQANKDTYGGTLRRNYRNQLKSYSVQEVIQGVICKLATRKAGSVQPGTLEYLCRQSEGLSQEYYVCHCPTTSQEAFGGSALPS